MDTGFVTLIPPNKGENEEKDIETIFQAPDSLVKIVNSDDVEALESVHGAVERNKDKDAEESKEGGPKPYSSSSNAASSGGYPQGQSRGKKDNSKDHANQDSHHGTVHVVDVSETNNEACSVEVVGAQSCTQLAHNVRSDRLNDFDVGESYDGREAGALVGTDKLIGTR